MKVLGAVTAALVGGILFAIGGVLLGYLMLEWFGGDDCCGFEGLGAPIGGFFAGAVTGLAAGAWFARNAAAIQRATAFTGFAVLACVPIWLAITWVVGQAVRFDIEDPLWIGLFLALTLLGPVVTAAWLVSAPRKDTPS